MKKVVSLCVFLSVSILLGNDSPSSSPALESQKEATIVLPDAREMRTRLWRSSVSIFYTLYQGHPDKGMGIFSLAQRQVTAKELRDRVQVTLTDSCNLERDVDIICSLFDDQKK